MARLDSAWAGVSCGMYRYQVLHDTILSLTMCLIVAVTVSVPIQGCWQCCFTSELLLGPVFETKAETSKSGNGVGRG